MRNRSRITSLTLVLLAPSALLCALVAAASFGAEPSSTATSAPSVTSTATGRTPQDGVVEMLMTRDLAGAEGKEARMLTVEYPPGGASAPHRHDAQVFVYVLEGTVRMQVEGSPVVTLKAGETFYEGPNDVHTVSANASQTQPARILVLMLKNKGAAPTTPVAPRKQP